MTDLLLRLFVKHASDTSDPAVRAGYGRLAGVTGIVCNLLLFALKLLAGTISGSVSITADAVNNLSDASGSIVTLVGFKLASRPADDEHPYGHARMEYLSGLAVAVLILVIGVELVKSSVGKILHPEAVEFSALIVVILVCSILVKLWMAVFNRKLGRRIGSAALTALALLVSYVSIVQEKTPEALDLSLTNPLMLVGLFIGAMLTFVFSAYTMSAVQTAAQSIVLEVRRQFREIAGIMEYKADPDYASCVALCTKGALREMVKPALLAIIVPILTGLILGPVGVAGLLGGVSVTGFAMAVFMSNAGGAWDNAKKYIESGHHGGKGSECHKAAVVGDTVGDPFKDTSGPSLNILIKLCSTVSIVFSGLIVAFHLLG